LCRAQDVETFINDDVWVLVGETYRPSDDSYALLEASKDIVASVATNRRMLELLEIGAGSGYVALSLAYKRFNTYVIAVDISPCAVESCRRNAILRGIYDRVDVVQCDAAKCIRSKAVVMVLFNPPYLPVEEFDTWYGISWSGGIEGDAISLRFLVEGIRCARNVLAFVISSIQRLDRIFREVLSSCREIAITECRHFFYETICCIVCWV